MCYRKALFGPPLFGQISANKVQIIKHEWTPAIHKIKLYCIMIILYRMHTKNQKKTHTPPKAAAIRLTQLLFPMCTKPRARYQNSEPPNQRNRSRLASRSNCGKDSPDKKPWARLIYITVC